MSDQFPAEEFNEMERFISEHYKLPSYIPADMVRAFLIMKKRGENSKLFSQLRKEKI